LPTGRRSQVTNRHSSAVVHALRTQFGIRFTIVEPGFFRTGLLDPRHVQWAKSSIEDYAADGDPEKMWARFHGTQPNDPDKLGERP
jgi:hypothetical protein